mgnify:CR=1 FL=1
MEIIIVNECGHPERPHMALMKCKSCYHKDYQAKNRDKINARRAIYSAKPENKAKARARSAAYYTKPEIRTRIAARSATYYTKPENRTKQYCNKTGTEYEEALSWFLIPNEDRRCWLCGENGKDMHLDHDHRTLIIRGWSHGVCNSAEGFVVKSPNPERLLASLGTRLRLP